MRLVLEDARVDEILKKVQEADMVLAEMEEKVANLTNRIDLFARLVAEMRAQPSLPFVHEGPISIKE